MTRIQWGARKFIAFPSISRLSGTVDEPKPEDLPVPQAPPEIPRGKLWTSLLVPPLLSTFLTLILAAASKKDYGIAAMVVLPVGLIAIIACLFPFLACLRIRYRGRSVTLLGWGFFLGQIILCLSLWFGACLLVLQ